MPASSRNNTSSLTGNRLAVRRRPDLRAVETRHKHESAVVVKDPVAMKYHRLRPDEYFVLEQLDGTATLDSIRRSYDQRFFPNKVSAADVNRLLFRFHQYGLTISNAAMQGDRLIDRRDKDRRQRWKQRIGGILFIRFPGVDPEPLLRRLSPLTKPLFNPVGLATAVLFCLTAGLLFVSRWDQFTSDFPHVRDWIRFESLLVLVAVIGVTKVLHEIGHALTCRYFGGECHQIGPMLLVFTPALYCDTSDSWMLVSRWHRAAVGLAGVATEVLLASIATFVWASTAPGIIHSIAMNVMVVCSVSTLLFNANPLLRYDGYYVLSDLVDVPNLADRSRRLLTAHVNKLCFGVDELPAESMTAWSRFWMLTYAIAAVTYRWCLTLLILWFVSLILRPYRLESIGRLLCVFAVGGFVMTFLHPIFGFMKNPARRNKIHVTRSAVSLLVFIGILSLAFFPFPSGVSAPARIVPRIEVPIYLSTAGVLREVEHHPGQWIEKGEVIATFVNHDVELQCLAAEGRYQTQKQVVESTRRISIENPEAANEIPSQESLLEDLRVRMENHRRRRDGLVVRAPESGRLIAAPHKRQQPDSPLRLVGWSGYPTDANNESCFLQSGQELMSVAVDCRWAAEIVLRQSEVDRVKIGAQVKLALESDPATTFRGEVTEVSRAEWTEELHHERRDDIDASRYRKPASTSYLVRVAIDPVDIPFMTGATVTSRIEAPSMSLTQRATRLLSGLFRFR